MEKENKLTSKPLSDVEAIRGYLESDIPVYLHGLSGCGKSARVKEIDPNAEIIYLRNATPESINGKSVYVPPLTKKVEVKNGDEVELQDVILRRGYMMDIKPSWLQRITKRALEEPDKIHVLFFDELSNALPAIQGFCFNIILEREVNGIWKLPENARVVAAGNELDDSIAACELAAPLFGRFAHMYIDDNYTAWMNWAHKNKIHPTIIAFQAATNGKKLRTKYTGEKPNADPRKWEMASKVLYATGNISLLSGLLGEDLTKAFEAFCNSRTISL